MATNTSGGTTSSFMNTPQAVDDSYNVVEDYIYCFDVMSNDLGGNAKILWSIDDSTLDGTTGISGSGDGAYDLLSQDAACVPELSDLGAKIWIESGKIRYDARVFNYLAANQTVTDHFTYAIRLSNGTLSWATVTIAITGTNDGPTVSAADLSGAVTEDASNPSLTDTGTITFDDVDLTDTHTTSVTASAGNTLGGVLTASVTDPATGAGDGTVTWNYSVANSATQYLAQGQTATESFTIRIQDNNGGYIDQIVVVTITGTNDGPTVSAADLVGAATEDAASPSLTDTGTITFDDLDLTDTHSTTVTPALGNTLGGTLTATVTDAATGAGDGTVTWNYSVANSATQYLAAGETASESFTIRISDNNGGYIDQVVVVTITGTNDKPDIRVESGDNALASINEIDSGLSAGGTLTVTDVDTLDMISTSIGLTNVTGPTGGLTNLQLLGMLSVAPSSGLAANTGDTNNLGWTFNSGSQAFDYLRAGQTLQLVYTLTVDDSNGGTDTQNVTITITGTNDAPVLSDTTDPSAVLELGDASAQNLSAITGSFSVTDKDVGDTLTASVVSGPVVQLNGGVYALPAGASALTAAGAFTLNPAFLSSGGAENVGYSYDPGAADLDFLRAGDSLTITYTVQVGDGTTTSGTQNVTFTITGTNDAPVLSDTADPSAVLELGDASAQNLSAITGSFSVTDKDVGDTLTASVVGGPVVELNGGAFILPAGASALTAPGAFTLDSSFLSSGSAQNVGYSYDPGAANLDFLGEGETLTITYTVQVGDGTTTSGTQDVTFTITGTNDAPVLTLDASGGVTEDASDPTLTDSGTLSFADADTTDTHVVSSVYNDDAVWTGGSLSAGQIAAISAGFSADSSGWDYSVANSALNFLAAGETITLSFNVTVTDDSGALNNSDTEVVTITITGTNDAPVLTGDLGAPINEGGSYQLTTADVNFTDPDDGAADVTFTATGLSNGTLYVNGIAQNTFTGAQLAAGLVTFTHDGSETLSAGFNISVEDGNEDSSAPVAQPFNFTVSPVNDAPVNTVPDGQAVNEDQTLVFSSGNGNAISISDADAGSSTVQVTLSVASGTLTLGSLVGLTVTAGANGSSTVTVQGTQAAINAGLQGLTYQGNLNFNGGDSLSIVTSDLGNSGSGGTLTDTDNVAITVNAVNDAPVNTMAASYSTDENTALKLSGLSVSDVDAGAGSVSITLSVASGTLSAANAGGVTVSGSGTGSVTLSGTLSDLNAFLAAAASQPTFTPVTNVSGSVTLTMSTSDNGNTGSGGALVDMDVRTITVVDVGAPPTDIVFTLAASTGSLVGNGINSGMTLGSLTAVDPDSGSWTFTIGSVVGQTLPAVTASPVSGSSVNLVTSGAIAAGNYQFTVTATDAQGNSFTETYTLSVGTTGGDAASFFTISAGTDISLGLNGADVINGGDGDDALVGGQSADTLNGGLGNDQLVGGAGGDNFLFNTTLNGSTNVDRILDFDAGGGPNGDHIQLDDAIFTQLSVGTLSAANFVANAGGVAGDANDYILYDTLTGNLYYDADGNGAGARVLFATITVAAGTIDPTDILIV